MEEIQHEKCNRCKCWRTPDYFLNNKGRKLKTCGRCREMKRKNMEKNKCEHGRIKYVCKECGGASICEHSRQKTQCKKCGGSSICEHNIYKSACKKCGGSQICEHNKKKSECKECGGGSICEHNRRRSECKECGGGSICEHNRIKSRCKECGGGSICEHSRRRSECKECGGASICEHNKIRRVCQICDPIGNLSARVRTYTYISLKRNKKLQTKEYLCCSFEELKEHIEVQFKEGMSWDNYGEWHIDHIVPLKYKNPTMEQVIERLHFTNIQPMWASENMSKGNRYIG